MGAREQLYGRGGKSRRAKKPKSGFPDSASFARMANRFKKAATSKIREKTGRDAEKGSNLASHMASALLTGNITAPSSDTSTTPSPNKSISFKNDIAYN